MQVMILAAGRSTRLGTLGLAFPKPLLPVCGHPAISYAALCWQAGLHDIVIDLHHHGDKLGKTLGDGSQFGVNLRYSVEDELLGTGGGVGKARSLFSSELVLVINGKVAAYVDLRAVIAAHVLRRRGERWPPWSWPLFRHLHPSRRVGAPGPVFGTWDSTNPDRPLSIHHENGCPVQALLGRDCTESSTTSPLPAKIKTEQCPLPHAQNPYRRATPPT